MGARGRDNSKWITNVQPRLAKIREWCIEGLTNEEMSKRLDINRVSKYIKICGRFTS